jgi:hypothetical protein
MYHTFSHAIGGLTQQRMLAALKPAYTNELWLRDHLGEIAKALEAGVPWSDVYELAAADMPQPLDFAQFASAVLAR